VREELRWSGWEDDEVTAIEDGTRDGSETARARRRKVDDTRRGKGAPRMPSVRAPTASR
jgi:hypothetical protein